MFTKSNEFKEAITTEKSVYAKTGFVSNGKPSSTVLEVQGENESMSERYVKIRGTNRMNFICYPNQENKGYRKALSLEWDAEADNPKVFIDHLVEPTGGGQAATKRYVDKVVGMPNPLSFHTPPAISPSMMFSPWDDEVSFIKSESTDAQRDVCGNFAECNSGLNFHSDSVLNPDGEVFMEGDTYHVGGFVSVYANSNSRLLLKAPVVKIKRIAHMTTVYFGGGHGWVASINYAADRQIMDENVYITLECFGTGVVEVDT